MTTDTAALELSYVKTIGMTSNSPTGRGFANPIDLAFTQDGRILVMNRGEYVFSRVTICDLDEEYFGEIGSDGEGDGQFRMASSIAVDSKGNVYTADEYLHRITVFDSSGAFAAKWGEHGSAPGQIDGPSGLAIDPDDNVYIVDQRNDRVQKFTSDGSLLAGWGESGGGPGQFNRPWGIGLDSCGNIYVADWRNDRIQKLSPDGEPIMQFGDPGGEPGQLQRPSGVAVTDDGYIAVADWGNERVQVFDSAGRFEKLLQGQATLSKWAEEFLAANPDEARTRSMSDLTPDLPDHLQTHYHVASQTEPYFWGPSSVKFDAEGRLYVTESARHRFQVYERQ